MVILWMTGAMRSPPCTAGSRLKEGGMKEDAGIRQADDALKMAKSPYIRLKRNFVLRGWKGLPYALVDRRTGWVTFMREDAFRALLFCNGRFAEDSPVFFGERKEALRQLDGIGALERLDEPEELSPDQDYREYPNRFIRQVHWSITGRCNYRCRHCYMSAPHAVLGEPTLEECLNIVDQIADCGVPFVSLTGGEPLVRRDFMQIVDRILERGMHIAVIMTNGSLVTEELLRALENRGVNCEFNMSFDGIGGWHDWLRGVEGAEGSVRRAFDLCREHGFVTGAEMVLHAGNIHTLRQSVRTLGELGATSLKVNRLNCVGEGAALADYAISCEEEYKAYLQYIPQYVEDGMPVPVLTLSGLFSSRHGKFRVGAERYGEDCDCSGKYLCNAARNTMYLGPDGRVLPCIPMSETGAAQERFPTLGNLTLAEALTESTYMGFITNKLADYHARNPLCASCEYRNRCMGGCRGRAALATGGADLMGPDPDTCLLFRGGYYNRTKEIVDKLEGVQLHFHDGPAPRVGEGHADEGDHPRDTRDDN